MNKWDMDELLIKNALAGIKMPQDAQAANIRIIKGVEAKMKSGKRIARRGFVMGILAASLMVATVAAAQIMGSFERLADIVGEEYAETLTPVEVTNVVPAATHTDNAEDEDNEASEAAQSEISIEWVAVRAYDRIVDVYFTAKDLAGNRLDGDFRIDHSIWPVGFEAGENAEFLATSDGHEVIHRSDCGKVTLRTRYYFGGPVPSEGLEINFRVWDITFGDFSYDPRPAAINLAEFAEEADSLLFRYGWPAGGGNCLYFPQYIFNKIGGDGLPVLKPQGLDIGFESDRIRSAISAMGIVDGRFHVQVFNPAKLYGGVTISLIRGTPPAGPLTWDEFGLLIDRMAFPVSTDFNIAADGSFYRDMTWATRFEEYIFEIDPADIGEYTMLLSAWGRDRVDIDWSYTFEVSQ